MIYYDYIVITWDVITWGFLILSTLSRIMNIFMNILLSTIIKHR